MGLLSTPEVKTVRSRSDSRSRGSPQNQKLEEGIAKIEENSPKLLKNQKIFSDFSKTGVTSSLTPYLWRADSVLTFPWMQGYTMQSLVALALTGTKCITNRQTNFLLYIYIDIRRND
jgi:hypothetical protein